MALMEKDKSTVLKCIVCNDNIEAGRGHICNVCYDNMRNGKPLVPKKAKK